jgi:microcompartment protein CcmK/EutM
MKLGAVVGRVTLNKVIPELEGARWLVVSPFTRDHYQRGSETPDGLSTDPTLVVYDSIGGNVGQTIGYVEGREAAQPFDAPTPVDAINVVLVDEVVYEPLQPAPALATSEAATPALAEVRGRKRKVGSTNG